MNCTASLSELFIVNLSMNGLNFSEYASDVQWCHVLHFHVLQFHVLHFYVLQFQHPIAGQIGSCHFIIVNGVFGRLSKLIANDVI